jgi:DNA-binding transcriptional LysR family regulator
MHTMDNQPNWEWYRSFLAVAETGSLSAAGRALGLAQPTVGRHIDGLEQALGLKLFTRSYDGYAPTEAASELRPYAASVAATTAALRRVASSIGDGVRGTVRITASAVVGVEVLPPILAALRAAHPALVIELVLSNAVDDLLQREADIAVRMVRPTQEALVAKRIGAIEIGLFAHQRYLAAHGTPQAMADLAGHALIGYDQESAMVRAWLARFPVFARAALALRCDSDLAQLGAIRAGVGIGWCQAGLAARDPALVRVLPTDCSLPLETWVAMHEDLRASPRCAVTFAALVAGLDDYIAVS